MSLDNLKSRDVVVGHVVQLRSSGHCNEIREAGGYEPTGIVVPSSSGVKQSDKIGVIDLLKPTGHVMHHQFNIQQLYALPALYLCVLYFLRTNSDLCHLQHKLIGFYNRDEKCLQRGTDWVFK